MKNAAKFKIQKKGKEWVSKIDLKPKNKGGFSKYIVYFVQLI